MTIVRVGARVKGRGDRNAPALPACIARKQTPY
jgi:hypothetical protein